MSSARNCKTGSECAFPLLMFVWFQYEDGKYLPYMWILGSTLPHTYEYTCLCLWQESRGCVTECLISQEARNKRKNAMAT